jgi:hypothetical protein
MTTDAILFMALSWGFVLALAAWAYWRVTRVDARRSPSRDGPIPVPPPTPEHDPIAPRRELAGTSATD